VAQAHPNSTNPSPDTRNPSPDDVIPRLRALAVAAEINASPLERKRVRALAREAAAEIERLRRRVEGLEMRLGKRLTCAW
jgi:hypothetical protein